MIKKRILKAVILPGILSGIVIWAVQSTGDNYLISAGMAGMRATLFPVIVCIVIPVLLVITGMISERIHILETGSHGTPWIPFSAGFLGMSSAIFLFLAVSYMNQYVPSMEPGLVPRIAFTAGIILLLLPLILLVSAVFALFSLAGGYCRHLIQRHTKRI